MAKVTEHPNVQGKPPKHRRAIYDPYQASGRVVRAVYDFGDMLRRHEVNFVMPEHGSFLTCDVTFGTGKKKRKILVLDPYGDDILPGRFRRHLLANGEIIGIFYDTGEIMWVGFQEGTETRPGCTEEGEPATHEDTIIFITLREFDPRYFVPKAYLKRLGELKKAKRPYYLTLLEDSVYGFITRHDGWGQLGIVVDLDFHGARIQVMDKSYREVTNWKRAPGSGPSTAGRPRPRP